MDLLKDPMLIASLMMALLSGLIMLGRQRRPEFWLLALTVLLYGLPRAGLLLKQVQLPLPLAHILAGLLVLEWLLLRRRRRRGQWGFTRYFIFYAMVAGFGLSLGITRGGHLLVAFLELNFYLFSMGLFFYAIETFDQRRHFILFGHLLLVIAFVVGLYGIAQKFFGRDILIPFITYASGGKDISRLDDYLLQARVLSSYGDPNVLACQLLIFEGIALALLVGKGLAPGTRLWGVIILSVTILCVFFTGSRAGMICLFLVPLVVFYWRTRWSLLILPALAALGFIFLPSLGETAILNQVGQMGPKMNLDPTDLRTQFPTMAWQLLQAVPFGCGWGRTVELEVIGLNWHFMLIPAEVIWMGFNSFWLNLFSRLGIPGVITFGLLLVMVFRYIWQRVKLIQDRWVQAFLIGSLAGFIGQWLIWVVNNTYMLPGGGLNFWFMLGMLVAGSRAFSEPRCPIWFCCPSLGTESKLRAYMNNMPLEQAIEQ